MTFDSLLEMLLIGLPGARPGGLLLSVFAFLGAALIGLLLGVAYAASCSISRTAALFLMPLGTLVRGVPPILLVFALAHAPFPSLTFAGVVGLAVYSFSHTGEILRAYVVAYPRSQIEAARVMGLNPLTAWLTLRLPWSLRMSLAPLATHWISLLKDTGALIVIGIGELTTVAKLLSSSTANTTIWINVLMLAGLLYLLTTFVLLAGVKALCRFSRIEQEGGTSGVTSARHPNEGWTRPVGRRLGREA